MSLGSSTPTELLSAPRVVQHFFQKEKGQTQAQARVFFVDPSLSLGSTCPDKLLLTLKVV
jgi:hypothetical protein